MRAFRSASGAIAFHEQPGDRESLELPCGRCIGCRLGRAQQWAVRCRHEAMLYGVNSFITLTYDDDHLPKYGSLNYRDYQLFMKRLRKDNEGFDEAPDGTRPIRFFAAGEYGGITNRPHYHALLFNYWFADAKPWGRGTFRSEQLEALWPLGSALIAPVTPASTAYVTRYALKKVYGRAAQDHYSDVDVSTGEYIEKARVPEFVRMSRRPGIGAWFFEQYVGDLYPGDYAVYDGRQVPVPEYYQRKLAELDPDMIEQLEYERYLRSRDIPREEKTEERRAVSEQVREARYNHFNKRGL